MRRDFRGGTEGHEAEIVDGDLADIDSCDTVLAAFTAPDEGTSMEAWYAHSKGISGRGVHGRRARPPVDGLRLGVGARDARGRRRRRVQRLMPRAAIVGNLVLDVVAGAPERPGGMVWYCARALSEIDPDADVVLVCRSAAEDRDALVPRLEEFGFPVALAGGRAHDPVLVPLRGRAADHGDRLARRALDAGRHRRLGRGRDRRRALGDRRRAQPRRLPARDAGGADRARPPAHRRRPGARPSRPGRPARQRRQTSITPSSATSPP